MGAPCWWKLNGRCSRSHYSFEVDYLVKCHFSNNKSYLAHWIFPLRERSSILVFSFGHKLNLIAIFQIAYTTPQLSTLCSITISSFRFLGLFIMNCDYPTRISWYNWLGRNHQRWTSTEQKIKRNLQFDCLLAFRATTQGTGPLNMNCCFFFLCSCRYIFGQVQLICAALEGGYVLLSWKLISPLIVNNLDLLTQDLAVETKVSVVLVTLGATAYCLFVSGYRNWEMNCSFSLLFSPQSFTNPSISRVIQSVWYMCLSFMSSDLIW